MSRFVVYALCLLCGQVIAPATGSTWLASGVESSGLSFEDWERCENHEGHIAIAGVYSQAVDGWIGGVEGSTLVAGGDTGALLGSALSKFRHFS